MSIKDFHKSPILRDPMPVFRRRSLLLAGAADRPGWWRSTATS